MKGLLHFQESNYCLEIKFTKFMKKVLKLEQSIVPAVEKIIAKEVPVLSITMQKLDA